MSSHNVPVAQERAIIAKLRSQGCTIDPNGCTSDSVAFTSRDGTGFFIPRPTNGAGYTIDELEFIERQIAWLDLEILPLDPHVG